jgi:uncharacterized protein with ParB-like and HNH nuclease domain
MSYIDKDDSDEQYEDHDDDQYESVHPHPWDPSKIRITTKHLSIREVVEQIDERDIDLSPDFQRDYVWKIRQQTRLVESILLGIPLPAFYFNQEKGGRYQVVDGVQRLTTIAKFMHNELNLQEKDLEYLKNFKGLTYDNLDSVSIRRFRSTQIVVHIIEPQTPDELKYDIFSRVNTSGTPLSAQEIRHAMSKQTSHEVLKELSESVAFDQATQKAFWSKSKDTGVLVRDSKRMMDRELILRFFALSNYNSHEYRSFSNMNAYLVEYLKKIDGRSEYESTIRVEVIKKSFNNAMLSAEKILGDHAFRKPGKDGRRGRIINKAVFEAQSIALSKYDTSILILHANEIKKQFLHAFDNQDFLRSVSVGTSSPTSIETRLEFLDSILKRIIC